MRDFAISGRNGFRKAAKRAGATHAVSLIDPGTPVPGTPSCVTSGGHIVLRFHDVDDAAGGPSMLDVAILVRHAQELPADAVVAFHCEAGVRRSTAAAIIYQIAQDRATAPGAALARVLAKQPAAWPNGRMLRLADAALGFDGDLAALSGRGRLLAV